MSAPSQCRAKARLVLSPSAGERYQRRDRQQRAHMRVLDAMRELTERDLKLVSLDALALREALDEPVLHVARERRRQLRQHHRRASKVERLLRGALRKKSRR